MALFFSRRKVKGGKMEKEKLKEKDDEEIDDMMDVDVDEDEIIIDEEED